MGLAVLIDRAGYRIAADCNVVKADDAVIVRDVAGAFAAAEEHLRRMSTAQEAVFEERVIDGYRAGLARGESEAAQKLVIAEVRRYALLESLKPAMADLVMGAVEMIARDLDRRAVVAQALRVLEVPIREATWAHLRVHPDAVESAEAALAECTRSSGFGAVARIVSDESLACDDCVFESEFGRIDAGLATQLDAIRGAIERAATTLVAQLQDDAGGAT